MKDEKKYHPMRTAIKEAFKDKEVKQAFVLSAVTSVVVNLMLMLVQ